MRGDQHNGAMLAVLHAITAFRRTRTLAKRLRTVDDVQLWQAKRLKRYLTDVVPKVTAFNDLRSAALADLPVTDKAKLMANFAAFNRPGISAAEVRAALDRGDDQVRGYYVGQSTGTSGNRGYYVINEAERFVWLGTILAKTLPDIWRQRHRVALALPAFSALYRSAEGRRMALRFFDLSAGVDAWADDLARFAPDTIVAPPKVLRRLAEMGKLPARLIFSGAEVLDPLDRAIIETATGAKVREIYMATEGLFGVGCPLGTLHLAEDAVHFEWEAAGDSGLVSPIITDFTRRTQVMARYRMNDLLLLSDRPCACGSPLQAVERIEGRQDDVFELPDGSGELRMVTPDVLRNAVVDADQRITDYRVVQSGPGEVTVRLQPELPQDCDTLVVASLDRLFTRIGVSPIVTIERGLSVEYDRKLRRVMRDY